jgi:ketosteroid isomerase-like protein
MERHLDERLALRVPRLYRRLIKLAQALPAGSPLRRRVLKRALARTLEALAREDDEVVLLSIDPAWEVNVIGDEFRALGFAEHYHGHEGWLELMTLWRAEWISARYTPELLIDLGDQCVIARITTTARGASSGAEVTQTAGYVFHSVDGAVVRQDFYWNWTDCVEALGLAAAVPASQPDLPPAVTS